MSLFLSSGISPIALFLSFLCLEVIIYDNGISVDSFGSDLSRLHLCCIVLLACSFCMWKNLLNVTCLNVFMMGRVSSTSIRCFFWGGMVSRYHINPNVSIAFYFPLRHTNHHLLFPI